MEIEKKYTCCFIGHRIIRAAEKLENVLKETIEKLIVEENVSTFLFLGKGKFETICFYIVSQLKQKYPHIQRIKANVGFSIFRGDFSDVYMESYYDDVYAPGRLLNEKSLMYLGKKETERIDMSSFCIAYYDENYEFSEDYLCDSGELTTAAAMEYAKSQDICIIPVVKTS